jgi:hypothetical protein
MGFFVMKGPLQISVQKTGMEATTFGLVIRVGLGTNQSRYKSELVHQVALT